MYSVVLSMVPALVPRFAFLTKGVGHDGHPLVAFDYALRAADISSLNLVPVSSVFPPVCRLIARAEGLKKLKPGQIAFCVMSRYESNDPGRRITAALGVALPIDENHYGYIAEHHAEGQTEREASREAEKLAVQLLHAKLGAYRRRVRVGPTLAAAATTRVPRGRWSSAIAACVFVL